MTDTTSKLLAARAVISELRAEIERLRAMPAYDQGYNHGLLAQKAEIEWLRTDYSILKTDYAALRAEIERLKAESEAWRECAVYDPMMEGPRFKTWNRSALDRCRKRFIEQPRAALEPKP
jgi:uncharacterized small protein (DUF1192 family)